MRTPALALAVLTGVVVATAAPAAAHVAGHLIDGSTIKPHSLPGNRLEANTVTGAQVNESTLRVVPKASYAKTAATADSLPPLSWKPLTLLDGWAAYGHGYNAPAYAVDAEGIVHLRGAIDGGVSDGVAFRFPASILAPSVEAQYAVAAAGGRVALLTVTDSSFCPLDGVAQAGSVASFTDLDGVTFAKS